MAGALASFTAMALAIRELSGRIPTFEILFFRSAVGIVVVLAVVAAGGDIRRRLASGQPRLQLMRNCIHFAGQWGWTLAIGLLPLATVFAIEFTTPIWTAMLAVLLLGERVNAARVAAVALGFAGILLIVRPSADSFTLGAFAALLSAFGFAGASVTTKALTRTDGPLVILFWMSVLQLPMGLVPAIFQWVWPDARELLFLLGVGLAGFGAHYCLSSALKLADATMVMPFDFIRLPLIAVIGFLFYDEALDPWVFAGGGLILFGAWLTIRYGQTRR